MYPEIFSIGNLVIHSYGLMIALAVLVAALALYREAPREKMDPDHVLEAVIVAAFSGVLGARILYMLLNWDYYGGQFFSAFFTRFEGLSFYGGFFAGIVALYFWSKWRGIGLLKLFDLLAPYLALGYAFGRIGCFLNGCCYGRESDLPWALPASAADSILRHPVQLYAALMAIAIFVILKLLRPKRPFVGFIFISLFFLYGMLRFTTEFFRYGEALVYGLTIAQLFSLGLAIISLIVIIVFGGGPGIFSRLVKVPQLKKKPKKRAGK